MVKTLMELNHNEFKYRRDTGEQLKFILQIKYVSLINTMSKQTQPSTQVNAIERPTTWFDRNRLWTHRRMRRLEIA